MTDYKIYEHKTICYPDKKVDIVYGEAKGSVKYVKEITHQQGNVHEHKIKENYYDLDAYFWKKVIHHNNLSNKSFGELEDKIQNNDN